MKKASNEFEAERQFISVEYFRTGSIRDDIELIDNSSPISLPPHSHLTLRRCGCAVRTHGRECARRGGINSAPRRKSQHWPPVSRGGGRVASTIEDYSERPQQRPPYREANLREEEITQKIFPLSRGDCAQVR
ncbi:unnamed protein product [Leptosia nina]|uniref:Uncharacterized protein n=1 Tax=Leptosia nina TaxID=320188 RepID=A0AAV1IXN5_9NEOP